MVKMITNVIEKKIGTNKKLAAVAKETWTKLEGRMKQMQLEQQQRKEEVLKALSERFDEVEAEVTCFFYVSFLSLFFLLLPHFLKYPLFPSLFFLLPLPLLVLVLVLVLPPLQVQEQNKRVKMAYDKFKSEMESQNKLNKQVDDFKKTVFEELTRLENKQKLDMEDLRKEMTQGTKVLQQQFEKCNQEKVRVKHMVSLMQKQIDQM
jgi:ABC-type multidrug transport system fused ATPase/permease subunit